MHRADHEPGNQGRQRAGGHRAQQPSQQAPQQSTEQDRGNDEKRIEQIRWIERLRILPVRRLGLRQLLAIDDPHHLVDAGSNAAAEIAGLEFRRDVLVDDALGRGVGERAFEAVTDLDAQPAIVLGDDEQRAVVDLLAADLPGLRDAKRILLDGLAVGRRHDQHRDLAALSRLQIPQRLRQRCDVAGRERAGLVDDASAQRRHRDERQRRTSPAQQQRKNGGSCSVHRRSSAHPVTSRAPASG